MADERHPQRWGMRAKSVALGLAYVLALGAVYSAFSV